MHVLSVDWHVKRQALLWNSRQWHGSRYLSLSGLATITRSKQYGLFCTTLGVRKHDARISPWQVLTKLIYRHHTSSVCTTIIFFFIVWIATKQPCSYRTPSLTEMTSMTPSRSVNIWTPVGNQAKPWWHEKFRTSKSNTMITRKWQGWCHVKMTKRSAS